MTRELIGGLRSTREKAGLVNLVYRRAVVSGMIVLAGCEPTSNEVVVARAADRSFTVDQAVTLLAPRTDMDIDSTVVNAVADLWIDYTLFAHALHEDSTLSHLDFSTLVTPQLEQEVILQLRDATIEADTAIAEGELREIFAREGPGVEARARHVLLALPDRPSTAQRDSVRREAERLRERILGGEDFAEIARVHSDDRGSGRQGGSLGIFGPGELVPSLDEAIFSLEVGEISPVVQSPFGYHVIELLDLVTPPFDSVASDFRLQVQERRLMAAESTFISGLQAEAGPRTEAGAGEVLREIASDPRIPLAGRTGRRVLARFEGGEVTLEEAREFLLTRSPAYLAQVSRAPTEVLEDQVIMTLVQRELLLEAASRRGFEIDGARRDSLVNFAREEFVRAGRQLGLIDLDRSATRPDGVTRAVQAIVGGIVSGQNALGPLGAIGVVVRERYRHASNEVGVNRVVQRISELRGAGFQPTLPIDSTAPPPDAGAGGDPGGAEPR
ncbi:MAG: peptidylprolyl isomerase [Longimicrobiales bacterium]|nr:peptidylprolyl isomerase [Longimicrobiales bacterium]